MLEIKEKDRVIVSKMLEIKKKDRVIRKTKIVDKG